MFALIAFSGMRACAAWKLGYDHSVEITGGTSNLDNFFRFFGSSASLTL